MNRLSEKNTIVTGAASGIGRATAIRFAREGARVALFDLNPAGLEDTAATIRAEGGVAQPFEVNLTDAAAVERAVEAAAALWSGLDAVFNGAGGSGRRWGDGPVDACTLEGWTKTIDLNLTSIFLMCKYTVPHLLKTRGAVVNLASVLGLVGDEDFATHAYAAAKSGIIGLSRAMAAAYAARGLRVNVIAPGLIATAMSQRAQANEHIIARLTTLQPLTGDFGQPEDIAAAAAYLASADARFVTGIVLPVDGGWTAR